MVFLKMGFERHFRVIEKEMPIHRIGKLVIETILMLQGIFGLEMRFLLSLINLIDIFLIPIDLFASLRKTLFSFVPKTHMI